MTIFRMLVGACALFATSATIPAHAGNADATYRFAPGQREVVFVCCGPNCECSAAFHKTHWRTMSKSKCTSAAPASMASIQANVRVPAGKLLPGGVIVRKSPICNTRLQGRKIFYQAPRGRGTVQMDFYGNTITVNIQ